MHLTVTIPGMFGDYLAVNGFNAGGYCTLTRNVRYNGHQFDVKVPTASVARFCDDLDAHITQCITDTDAGLASHQQRAGARMMRKRVAALRVRFNISAGAANG